MSKSTRNFQGLLSSTILVGSLLAMGGTNAFAQSSGPVIDEIIVTATKSSQSSQDLGLALTAVSGENLRKQGIDSGQDLAKIVPNVSIQNIGGGGLPVVIVRGIGLQNFRVNDSPTTSFYMDEVYQTSIVSAEFSMYDLERVEILKGPQGGLYGRNTIGGAIQIISTKPQFDEGMSGFLTAGIGRYSETEIETGINIPLSDKVAARVSGRLQKSGDLYTTSIPGGFDQGGLDRLAGRFQLRAQPSDTVEFNLKLHGGRDNSANPLLRTVGLYKNIGNAGAFGAPGASLGLVAALVGAPGGGLCDSILAGNGSDPNTCATLTGVTPAAYGLRAGEDGIYDSAVDDQIPGLDTDWFGASLIGTFDFGDLTLTSISAYDKIDYARTINADATPVVFQDIDYATEIESWQQEFRLAYTGSDAYSWIIGVNYAEDDLVEDTLLKGGGGVLPLFFGGAVSSPQNYVQSTKAFAVYGHGEFNLTDALRATAELRYTDASKTFAGGQTFVFASGATAPFFNVSDEKDFQAVSGKLGMDYRANDDVLLFASISRGFKTGGFFGGFATNVGQLAPFDEETIWAYEAGFKSDLMDRRLRLNGSVFYYDRQDVQQSATAPATAGNPVTIARLSNIGDIRAYGAELDLTYLAGDYLTLNAGIGLTDSKVDKSDFTVNSVLPLLGAAQLEGTNTPNYSKFSANLSARYERPISDNFLGSAQVEYGYRSSRDLSLITDEKLEAPLFREDGYGLVNLRIGVGDIDEKWGLTFFVENLLDETYRVESRADGLFGLRELYGSPRVAGASLAFKWGG